jgi:hypothetical protein
MEFKLDAAELSALAQIEADTNCDIGAGEHWRQKQGADLAQATGSLDQKIGECEGCGASP